MKPILAFFLFAFSAVLNLSAQYYQRDALDLESMKIDTTGKFIVTDATKVSGSFAVSFDDGSVRNKIWFTFTPVAAEKRGDNMLRVTMQDGYVFYLYLNERGQHMVLPHVDKTALTQEMPVKIDSMETAYKALQVFTDESFTEMISKARGGDDGTRIFLCNLAKVYPNPLLEEFSKEVSAHETLPAETTPQSDQPSEKR
jgi:hypothetical protein